MRGIYRSALATKLQAFVNQCHGRPQWPSAGHYHSDNKACHISFTIGAQNSGFSSTIDVLLCHEHGWCPAPPPSSVAPPVRFINASTNARHSAMFGWTLGSSDADTFCHWKMNGKICTRLKKQRSVDCPSSFTLSTSLSYGLRKEIGSSNFSKFPACYGFIVNGKNSGNVQTSWGLFSCRRWKYRSRKCGLLRSPCHAQTYCATCPVPVLSNNFKFRDLQHG